MAASPEFALAELLSLGFRRARGSAEVERGCCSGLGGAGDGRRLPVLGDGNKCRGGAAGAAAAAAERWVARTARPLSPPPGPLRGPGMGGWKPGRCPSGAGEINGLLAVEKAEPRKLGFPFPISVWLRGEGARRGRVAREQQTKRKLRTQALTFLSCGNTCCALKGIYSYLG